MRRVLALLGSDLRFVGRGETSEGILPSDDRDAWTSRIRRLLREVSTPTLAQMLAEDDLSPSGSRHDRSTLERLVADRLARGGWRLATGQDHERGYVLPGGVPEEEEGELEGEYETLSVSFYVETEPRYVDAEIDGELEPEDFEVGIEGEIEPEIIEAEIEGDLVPAGVRGWVLGGELEEADEQEEEELEIAQADGMRAAAKEGVPFCEECALEDGDDDGDEDEDEEAEADDDEDEGEAAAAQ